MISIDSFQITATVSRLCDPETTFAPDQSEVAQRTHPRPRHARREAAFLDDIIDRERPRGRFDHHQDTLSLMVQIGYTERSYRAINTDSGAGCG